MCLIKDRRESLTNEADGPKELSRENKPYVPKKKQWLSKFVLHMSGGWSITSG